MTELLISNCDILTVEAQVVKFRQKQDIWIKDNRITAITDHQDKTDNPGASVQCIDGTNKLAIPGLINTHAHVPMVLFRGLAEDVTIPSWFNDFVFPLESNETPEDIYWGALLGIAEMIENGVTSFADHYFFMDEVAQAVEDSGTRANLVWAVFGHQGESKLKETGEFVKRWQGAAGGRITTWLGPHAPYTCSPEFLRLSSNFAKELNVGIHIHVSETADQVKMSLKEHGKTPVKILQEAGIFDVPSILGHCLYPTDDDIEIIKNANTGVAHAPKTYLKHGGGTVDLNRYLRAGVPIGLATDGAMSNNTMDILEQLRLMVLSQKDLAKDPLVMTIPEALEIAFNGSARVFQHANDLGDIAVGKLADIVLMEQDGLSVFPRFNPAANLIYSSNSRDVNTVICNGKVLMQDHKLLTIDKDTIKQEIMKRLERLSQRVPEKRIAFYPS